MHEVIQRALRLSVQLGFSTGILMGIWMPWVAKISSDAVASALSVNPISFVGAQIFLSGVAVAMSAFYAYRLSQLRGPA